MGKFDYLRGEEKVQAIKTTMRTAEWQNRRYEIAKAVLPTLISMVGDLPRKGEWQRCCSDAIDIADELIIKLLEK